MRCCAASRAGARCWRRDGHVVTVATVLDESGYTEMWQQDKSPEAPGRLENLKELVRALADFETLAGFLDHVSLVMENDENAEGDRVSLMTLHGAKGLEFDTVFLPGWEEGLFPNQRALDEGGVKSLEEERRLAYVGLTRARRRAIVSHAANRRIYANWQTSIPSRFIEELPDADVERTGSAALARDARMLAATDVHRAVPAGGAARRGRSRRGSSPARPARGDAIPVGARVFHQKFGYGTVTAAEDDRLDVAFDKAGRQARARPVRGEGVRGAGAQLPWSPSRAGDRLGRRAGSGARSLRGRAVRRPVRHGRLLPRLGKTGDWRVEGVKAVGSGEAELAAALALAAVVTGRRGAAAADVDAGRGLVGANLCGISRTAYRPPVRCARDASEGDPPAPGRITLTLDAGLAFGSGEHGSTRGCLRALERVAHRRPRRILDLGTGSGILAMAAARLLHRPVLGDRYRAMVGSRGAAEREVESVGWAGAVPSGGWLAASQARGRVRLTIWYSPTSWPVRCA